jgi:endonuclease YncB( thermonuclease family)
LAVPIGNRRRIFVRQSRRHAVRAALRSVALLVFAAAGAFAGLKLIPVIGARAAFVQAQAQVPVSLPVQAAPREVFEDVAAAAPAALASENVAVVDGETLRLSGHVVRLEGVAAPRRGEACRLATDCAGAAASRLARLVRDQRVACTVDGADQVGRAVASCQAGGTDINRAVVASGWALASVNSPGLKQAEQTARAQHLGLWAEP